MDLKLISPAEDFNSKNKKPFIDFHMMVPNYNYPVVRVYRAERHFGEQIEVESYDEIISLPTWCNNKITDEEINKYNKTDYYFKREKEKYEFKISKFVEGYKNIIKRNYMVINKSYPILQIKRTITRCGETIKVEVFENIIFLPDDFNAKISDDTIQKINNGKYCLKRVNNEGNDWKIQAAPTIRHHRNESNQANESSLPQLQQDCILECKTEPETVISQTPPNNINDKINDKESSAWIRVTNEQLSYDLNIEMEAAPTCCNENDINNIMNEERVDLNRVLKEEKNVAVTEIPQKFSPLKDGKADEIKCLEKFLEYYDNNTILLSDDDEEDEVDDDDDDDDDDDFSISSIEPNAATVVSSTAVNTNDKHKYKCLLCPRKHTTKTERSMLKHMNKHHNINNIDGCEKFYPKVVLCEYCNKSFTGIRNHIKKMHPHGYKHGRLHRTAGQNKSLLNMMPQMKEFLRNILGGLTKEASEYICRVFYMEVQQLAATMAETSNPQESSIIHNATDADV